VNGKEAKNKAKKECKESRKIETKRSGESSNQPDEIKRKKMLSE
jgi:hypothetical protein